MTWQQIWLASLGSALLGGVVAAVTALIIVNISAGKQRRHQRDLEARAAVAELVSLSIAMSVDYEQFRLVPDEQAENRLQMRWKAVGICASAALLEVNATAASKIVGLVKPEGWDPARLMEVTQLGLRWLGIAFDDAPVGKVVRQRR